MHHAIVKICFCACQVSVGGLHVQHMPFLGGGWYMYSDIIIMMQSIDCYSYLEAAPEIHCPQQVSETLNTPILHNLLLESMETWSFHILFKVQDNWKPQGFPASFVARISMSSMCTGPHLSWDEVHWCSTVIAPFTIWYI